MAQSPSSSVQQVVVTTAVAKSLLDTIMAAAKPDKTPAEAKLANARLIAAGLSSLAACFRAPPVTIVMADSVVQWAYDTSAKQNYVDAFVNVCNASWMLAGTEWTGPLAIAHGGQTEAMTMISDHYIHALKAFDEIGRQTPDSTFSSARFAEIFSKEVVSSFVQGYVDASAYPHTLTRFGVEMRDSAALVAGELYSWAKEKLPSLFKDFQIGLRLLCGEYEGAAVSATPTGGHQHFILGMGVAEALPSSSTFSSSQFVLPRATFVQAFAQMRAEGLLRVLDSRVERDLLQATAKRLAQFEAVGNPPQRLEPGFVSINRFLQIGVSSSSSSSSASSMCTWSQMGLGRFYGPDQALQDLDTYSNICAYVKRYNKWAMACEAVGIAQSHDVPMDPSGLLKTWLEGPFTHTADDGTVHIFYNRNYNPPGCVIA